MLTSIENTKARPQKSPYDARGVQVKTEFLREVSMRKSFVNLIFYEALKVVSFTTDRLQCMCIFSLNF